MHLTCKISPKPNPGLRVKTFSVFLTFGLLTALQMLAQVRHDFSDADLTINPSWQGMTDNFIVNSGLQLQLNSAVAGSSWLSTPLSSSEGQAHTWEFWIKQAFAPSGANFGRVYLFSDRADLSNSLNGYYLQLGEAGSADAIELFRQSGMTRTSVFRGSSGAIAAAFEIRVKVLHSADGVWQLWVDYSGVGDFILEASGVDGTYTSASYFGILFTYTVSNVKGFFFDDVSIESSSAPDTSPPQLRSVEVSSSSSLQLVFSEPLDAGATNPQQYFAAPRSAHPRTVVLKDDGETVVLSFADAFENGHQGTLTVNGIKDLAGNEMSAAEIKFQYFVPAPVTFGDVILTEIFADPSPLVSLPEEEFVEVFNRSNNPVQLKGWQFSDGPSRGRFPEYILLPGNYLVACAPAVIAEYQSMGPAVALSNFPALNNGGDRLLLADSTGKVIDSVRYSVDWYRDDDKASGGWTLERIDPENFCGYAENWRASEDARGGTPGEQNSVYATRPDNIGPKLVSVTAIGPTVLIVTFDERIENAIPSPDQFVITPAVDIRSIEFTGATLDRLTLTLNEEIQPGKNYSLTAVDLYDCPGNRIQKDFSTAVFVLPQRAVAGDIIVNEILFNPSPTGVDFLEIYNRSEKTVDLKGWSIRNPGTSAGKNTTMVSFDHSLISPNEYRVFTEDAVVLKGEYLMGKENAFAETDLPAFNDDAGSAVLIDDKGMTIDSMFYLEEMHSPFLKDAAGVSLERISLTWLGGEAANWRSAASTAGFATPGYANSNLRASYAIDDDAVIVEPELIQLRGGSDFTQIRYRFDNVGFLANVKIFDQEGRIIRNIAANALLGTEGFFRWDGDRDDGSRARMGYYFVWFEVFNAEGQVETYRKRVVVY
jgi:hypothetical protein